MISRAIMAPKDILIDSEEAKRVALLFDRIIIWGLEKTPFTKEQEERYWVEFEYLRDKGVVLDCGLEEPDLGLSNRQKESVSALFGQMNQHSDMKIPFHIFISAPRRNEGEASADRMVNHLSRHLSYHGTPVASHSAAGNLSTSTGKLNAIQVALNQFPLPPINTPWEDFIQFRSEEENMARLRSLRIWLSRLAIAKEPPALIKEAIEQALFEYETYMKLQYKKYGKGVLSTLLIASAEALENVADLKFGSALRSLLDIEAKHTAFAEAELLAPGREVSYISKAKTLS